MHIHTSLSTRQRVCISQSALDKHTLVVTVDVTSYDERVFIVFIEQHPLGMSNMTDCQTLPNRLSKHACSVFPPQHIMNLKGSRCCLTIVGLSEIVVGTDSLRVNIALARDSILVRGHPSRGSKGGVKSVVPRVWSQCRQDCNNVKRSRGRFVHIQYNKPLPNTPPSVQLTNCGNSIYVSRAAISACLVTREDSHVLYRVTSHKLSRGTTFSVLIFT